MAGQSQRLRALAILLLAAGLFALILIFLLVDVPPDISAQIHKPVIFASLLAIVLIAYLLWMILSQQGRKTLKSSPQAPPPAISPEDLEPLTVHSGNAGQCDTSSTSSSSSTVPSEPTVLPVDTAAQNENHIASLVELGMKIDDMKSYFRTFNNKLEAKEQELKRYREGYDHKLLNKYIKPFCRTHQRVKRMIEKTQGSSKELESIRDTIMDALERCGIETFKPDINDKLHHQMGDLVDDRPETVPTEDEAMDGRICKVLNPGYRHSEEPRAVLLSAEVSVYHYNK